MLLPPCKQLAIGTGKVQVNVQVGRRWYQRAARLPENSGCRRSLQVVHHEMQKQPSNHQVPRVSEPKKRSKYPVRRVDIVWGIRVT